MSTPTNVRANLRILALDLSLTRTGFATSDGSSGVLVPRPPHDRDVRRLAWYKRQLQGLLRFPAKADLVVLEGYSFGAAFRKPDGTTVQPQAGVRAIGELGGVVRLTCFEAGVPYVEVPPSNLKQYATGKGNAPKDAVIVAAAHRLNYRGGDNNEVDALFLLAMALDHYQLPGRIDVPQQNRKALVNVPWNGGGL
jgi:crossover junction endodeoxyribonuclease RuvC